MAVRIGGKGVGVMRHEEPRTGLRIGIAVEVEPATGGKLAGGHDLTWSQKSTANQLQTLQAQNPKLDNLELLHLY